MKKIIFAIAALGLVSFGAAAQNKLTGSQKTAAEISSAIDAVEAVSPEQPKPKYWTRSLKTTVNFGQTSLTNWAAGGYNSYSLRSYLDGSLNYAKDKTTFTNRLQLDYGLMYSADKPIIQKTDDRIYLESKYGYKTFSDKLYITASYNFKSQFTASYKYVTPAAHADGSEPTAQDWKDAAQLKSTLLSPAYTNIALGINYIPTKWLTVNFAPLTGGLVIVTEPTLRKTFGNGFKAKYKDNEPEKPASDASESDWSKYYKTYYQPVRFEFGAELKMDAKINVNDVLSYTTQLVLFSNYLDNPQNMRVNWDNTINYKLSKYLSLNLITNMIYDPKIKIKNDSDLDKYPDGIQRIQFKESLALGLVFTF